MRRDAEQTDRAQPTRAGEWTEAAGAQETDGRAGKEESPEMEVGSGS